LSEIRREKHNQASDWIDETLELTAKHNEMDDALKEINRISNGIESDEVVAKAAVRWILTYKALRNVRLNIHDRVAKDNANLVADPQLSFSDTELSDLTSPEKL